MTPILILHHHEITLKGGNRKFFEKQLMRNVRLVLSEFLPASAVSGGYGRFIVTLKDDSPHELIIERLRHVFGIANICNGVRVGQDVDTFSQVAERLLEPHDFKTIRVETRRVDKSFPIGSMKVNGIVGQHLCSRFGVRANMTSPDETVYIEIVEGVAYVYRSKTQGAFGLPVGVSGKVVALLSAGFDSPVAAWKLMKRGATVVFVHFHSMPYTSQHSVDQVRVLAGALTKYQYQSKLYLVPFAEVQQEIVLRVPQSLRIIFYRRMMVRIAEAIARRENAEALVTGEAVGQVASQTLRNIRVIDEAATLPILRPLSGTDKEETIAIARRIGTHDTSREPYDDCCSFLAPRKPETWAKPEDVFAAEAALDVQSLIQSSIEKISFERFTYPTLKHADYAPAATH